MPVGVGRLKLYVMFIKLIRQVFSFVFGDGDPNDGLEEKRWKMVFFSL